MDDYECDLCDGYGVVETDKVTPVVERCPKCDGTGKGEIPDE